MSLTIRTSMRWVLAASGLGLGYAYLQIDPRLLYLGLALVALFLGATDFGRQCPLFQGLKNIIVRRNGLYEKIDH